MSDSLITHGFHSAVVDPLLIPLPPALLEPEHDDGWRDVVGDLALSWVSNASAMDIALIDGDADLEMDRGLETAMLLSLFTDRRAADDDVPPSGDPTDRRGWWGDQFSEIRGDKYGSRLWLLDRSKRSNETLLKAKEYARESLAWMLEDRVAASIDITTEWGARGELVISVELQRPGRDQVAFQFAYTWDNL